MMEFQKSLPCSVREAVDKVFFVTDSDPNFPSPFIKCRVLGSIAPHKFSESWAVAGNFLDGACQVPQFRWVGESRRVELVEAMIQEHEHSCG